MTAAVTRRRFLTISAAALVCPVAAHTEEWHGTGFGAALSVRLEGTTPQATLRARTRIEAEVGRVERLVSLFADSALRRLNRDGRLAYPAPDLLALFDLCGRVHAATGGVFDPSVQPLWQALAEAGDAATARSRIGWARVQADATAIRLDPGMALTFNGIAQGWAADRVATLLRAEGFDHVLIDMGEVAAIGARPDGQPWRAAIAGPDGRTVGRAALADRALATSSPMGTLIGANRGHILHPAGTPPRWSTVSVSAPSAALADALSTAFCLMPRDRIAAALAAFPGARCEYLG